MLALWLSLWALNTFSTSCISWSFAITKHFKFPLIACMVSLAFALQILPWIAQTPHTHEFLCTVCSKRTATWGHLLSARHQLRLQSHGVPKEMIRKQTDLLLKFFPNYAEQPTTTYEPEVT